ncbi:MAG TPA: response regulator [Anaerolineae bacterium]|nr:response regulator [Anaerolineae bacterium]
MRILIVEDDPDARKVLSLILKLDGFQISTASGGQEAIQALQKDAPDLILLDVMMPVVDGYEVCRWVRSNPATAHIAVVMLSGKADPESVARGLEVGADEYLAKPIKPSNLTKQLHEILTRAAAKLSV